MTESKKWTRARLMAAYRKVGKNFMTPTVLAKRVLVSQGRVVELSEGTGFDRQPIYGVSVLTFDEAGERTFPDPDPSKMFHAKADAVKYYQDA